MIDHPIDHLHIHWTPVVKNFDIQWKALVDRKKSDEPDIPKITRTLPVLKWTEAFLDYLHRIIGSHMIPMAYVIREHANPQGQLLYVPTVNLTQRSTDQLKWI